MGYAIFDEGHMLKNMNTHRYQQLMKIGARRRLLLTGTPLQNNLLELMSLLKFIMPDLLQKSSATLQKIFKLRNSESDFARQRVFEAKTILQPFVLRRVKADVLKDLPPKVEETIMVDLTDQQKMFYYEIQDRVRSRLNVAQNGEDASKTQLKNEFMQLRKVANHPLLHRNHYTPDILRKMARTLCQKELAKDGNAQYIFEDFEVMSDFQIHQTCEKYKSLKKFKLKKDAIFNSGKFKTLDTLLPQLLEEDHRVVLFSQFVIMMDILERYFLARNIKYLRLDGSTPVDQRLELIDEFNADYDINVFMISTKAGGLGINLTSADTVIIHDIDSNPFNDKQAEDRCHRVGQTKEVKIIRLITKDTIEIKMRKMALEKLKLEDKMGMEDKMLYKRRSMETGEPVLEPDDDSNDGPNDDELVNLLRADSPTNVIANGTSKVKTETRSGSDVKTEARAESDIKIEAENGTEKEPLKELSPNQTPQLVHNEVKMETD